VLLASTALSGALALAIATKPGTALAACIVTANPNIVACDTTSAPGTTNTNAATSPSNDGTQRFTTGGHVTAIINAGAVISNYGLRIETSEAGAGITMTNNGTAGGVYPVALSANGGLITYRGSGTINSASAPTGLGIYNSGDGAITIGTKDAPITPNFTAGTPIYAEAAGAGNVTAFLHGGSVTSTDSSTTGFGIDLRSTGVGDVAATLTGSTTIGIDSTQNPWMGVSVKAYAGNASATSNANIATASGNRFRYGLVAEAWGGNTSVTQTGGTIFAAEFGLYASSDRDVTVVTAPGSRIDMSAGQGVGIYAESNGALNVTADGTINAANGIVATSNGTITITQSGQIGSATVPALVGISATSFAGRINVTAKDIFAVYNAVDVWVDGGSGNVSVTADGALSASGAAIRARNSGTGSITVTTAAGSAITGGGGIEAQSYGGGAISITNAGTITTSSAHGISAASSGNIVVTSTGVIAANWAGINASASGSGTVTVNVANDVTSGIGGAVLASAADGNVAVNVNGGTVRGTSWYGVQAGSGTGHAFVTIGAGATVHGVDIDGAAKTLDNAGTIVGDAVFHNANNLFVMNGPGASLSGSAQSYGSGTVRFAGSGSNSFDLSKLNANWTLIDKTGSSNWSLTGTSTYTGPVTINGGTLSVNTDLTGASGITVNSGALGGGGTVGDVTINAGGGLAPGNSIGTITLGSLNFVGAGNYIVEVDGATSDKTIVTGTATLDGKVVVTPLSRVTAKTTYNILTATTINGAFRSAVMANNFGRNPTLRDDGFGNIFLTVDIGFLSPILTGAVTPNQTSVANAIDTHLLGGGGIPASFDALFLLSPGGLKSALDQLSGEVHASTTSLLADEAGYARNAILGRLRQASFGGNTQMAALATGGPQAFADGDEMTSALAFAKPPIVRKAPMLTLKAQSDVVFWAQGFGAWGRFDGDGNAATARRDLAGFFTGLDTRAGDAGRVGIAAGYTGAKNNADGRGSSNVDTAHVAAYAGWSSGALNLRAGGVFAAHSINTDRTIAIPGLFDRTFANYDGHTGQVFGEFGYGFALANIAVEPFAGAAWVRVRTDGATERGRAAALNVSATTFETGTTTLGIRAASMLPVGDNMILIPRASVAWQHAFGDTTPSATLAFAAMPVAPFTVSGVPIARDALLAEIALDLAIGRHATLGVAYTGQIAPNVADHGAKGKFSYRF